MQAHYGKERGKIKESSVHRDAYIIEDHARAIQKEPHASLN